MQPHDSLWKHDLPHIGTLCRRIRESRSVRPTDIARWCDVDESTITRNLEERGGIAAKTFKRYIEALQLPGIADPPITEKQAVILWNLYENRSTAKISALENNLSAISFADIRSKRRSILLTEIVTALEKAQGPALIMDDLWFVHAVNGALLNLYTIDSGSEFLYRWEAWHDMAIKFSADSPVRGAHLYTNAFLAFSLTHFLENGIYPYLFTSQIRYLIRRLITLSEQQNFAFHEWWKLATSFSLPFEDEPLARLMWYQGQTIQVAVAPQMHRVIDVSQEYPVGYTLVAWQPLGSEAQQAFTAIQHQKDSHLLFYAADYDMNKDFHINK